VGRTKLHRIRGNCYPEAYILGRKIELVR